MPKDNAGCLDCTKETKLHHKSLRLHRLSFEKPISVNIICLAQQNNVHDKIAIHFNNQL